jgi:uncharacterized delta-60 repeat protein
MTFAWNECEKRSPNHCHFGSSTLRLIDLASPEDGPAAAPITVQSDGKVLITGYFDSVDGIARTVLARLNANGSLDNSFVPATNIQYVYTATLQPDGKLLASCWFCQNASCDIRLVRLNSNGSLDNTFNPGEATIFSIAAQPDGKILVAGSFSTIQGTNRAGVARLNADGINPGTTEGQSVNSIALSNGDVLIGGGFLTINGVLRPYAARLYGDSSAPPLNITRSNALMIISWRASAAAYSLQESTNLSPASSWTLVPQPVTTNSGQNSVMVPASAATRFFRLTSL